MHVGPFIYGVFLSLPAIQTPIPLSKPSLNIPPPWIFPAHRWAELNPFSLDTQTELWHFVATLQSAKDGPQVSVCLGPQPDQELFMGPVRALFISLSPVPTKDLAPTRSLEHICWYRGKLLIFLYINIASSKKFIWVFPWDVAENSNEFSGQHNKKVFGSFSKYLLSTWALL